MKCYIKVYNRDKWEEHSEKIYQYDLNNVKSFEVVQGEENTGMMIAPPQQDTLHEYLIIHFEDGGRTVFLNSRVALFRY